MKELDTVILVDDSLAALALNQLRAEIPPRLKAEQVRLNRKVEALREKTMLTGLCLIPLFLFSTFLTIGTIRRQANNVNELTAIFNASPDGIIYVNASGHISKANDAALSIFGYSAAEFLRLTIEDLVPRELRDKHIGLRLDFMSEEQMRYMGSRDSQVNGLRKDGSVIELNVAIATKRLGKEMVSICVIEDMTKLNKLKQKSDSDHLTSLSNRRRFDYILSKELNRVTRNNRQASLLLIDLDHFKELNDEQGHLEGDKALRVTAQFLTDHSRECDYVARWGGDEFAILCPDLRDDEAIRFAERLRAKYEEHMRDQHRALTLSIGITDTDCVEYLTPQSILESADKAVYAAKEAGKNSVVHYSKL